MADHRYLEIAVQVVERGGHADICGDGCPLLIRGLFRYKCSAFGKLATIDGVIRRDPHCIRKAQSTPRPRCAP